MNYIVAVYSYIKYSNFKMISVFILIMLGHIIHVAAQEKLAGIVTLNFNFQKSKQMPLKVIVESKTVAGYIGMQRQVKVYTSVFKYEINISEPELVTVNLYWNNNKLTSTSPFWVFPAHYEVVTDGNLHPVLSMALQAQAASRMDSIRMMEKKYFILADELAKGISYENKKVEDVEKKIWLITDSIESLQDKDLYLKEVISDPNSIAALHSLWCYASRPYNNPRYKSHPKLIDSLYNLLGTDIQSMPSAKMLVAKMKLEKQLSIGNKMQPFDLPDAKGEIYRLSNFKGKYVLVDFWASWCMPCRAENPLLIKNYNKYKNYGFVIIGITQDNRSSKNNWLEAICQDKINLWLQLSDFDKQAQKIYDIETIPANFLVNPDGIIIARNLHGNNLEKELEKIFKK